MTAPFPARYDVHACPGCDGPIVVGDVIVRTEDGLYVHAYSCAPAAEPPAVPPVCGSCWTTKPCECDDPELRRTP